MAILEPATTQVKVDLTPPIAAVLSQPDLPLATLLREGTAHAHEVAEKSDGAKLLVSGELDKMEYVRYLMMLWHVYDALEAALDAHATSPTLAPTHNPLVLARTHRIASDLAVLLDVPEFSIESHPLHQRLLASAPDALHVYVERIEGLAAAGDAARLLAHAYVRYLGDLSGGQVIRRRVAKAYNLSLEDGLGTRFYEFNKLDGSEPANAADARKIKEWYRNGMNEGVGDDQEVKAAVVEEANRVFELNGALLATLHFASTDAPISPRSPLSPLSSTTHLLGPSSPTSPTASSSSTSLSTPSHARSEETETYNPLSATLGESKVLYDATQDPNSPAATWGDSLISVNTVIPLILAFGAAHFIMVVFGLMGRKGEEKWVFVANYMRNLFGVDFERLKEVLMG